MKRLVDKILLRETCPGRDAYTQPLEYEPDALPLLHQALFGDVIVQVILLNEWTCRKIADIFVTILHQHTWLGIGEVQFVYVSPTLTNG